MKPSDKQPKEQSGWAKTATIAAAGSQLGATLGVSAFLGAVADEKLGTGPWLFLLLLVTGFIGGFWNFFRILKRYQGSDSSGPEEPGNRSENDG